MTTLFKAPQIGEPRSVGVKNGGVTSYDTRIVHPVTRIVGDSFESGKQIEFRWRSSSGQYHNPRETKLGVRYKVKFGNNIGDGVGALTGQEVPSNVRMTACANTCLFADGWRYQSWLGTRDKFVVIIFTSSVFVLDGLLCNRLRGVRERCHKQRGP